MLRWLKVIDLVEDNKNVTMDRCTWLYLHEALILALEVENCWSPWPTWP